MRGKGSLGLIIVLSSIFIFLMWSWISTENENQKETETVEKEQDVVLYENAWIVKMEAGEVLLYENGDFHNYKVNSDKSLGEILADVTVTGGKITHISIKDDVIEGKILAVSEDKLEVEGYGQVKVAENAAILKNYGELENVTIKDVVVGYTSQELIVGDGEICGIIMNEPVVIDNIRVMIMTNNYAGQYHDKVEISSEDGLIIESEEEEKEYARGEAVFIDDSTFGEEDRLFVRTVNEDGRIKLCSVKRQSGNPVYRGSFELVKTSEGIIVINEVSLEEYLYSVVPSEMPASYGVEALKAQAVCARSYAYKQILENKLGSYGAHVNDSSQYQVYNNIGEHANAIQAVDETRGQILTYEGEVVEAYYFSTSCGHTTDAVIWGGNNLDYIKGKLIDGGDAELVLDTEEKFSEFIKNKNFESYDMEYEWYRWEVQFSIDTINRLLKKAGLYDKLGDVTNIEIIERGTGGIVNKLQVTGDKGSVIIEKEYTIRQFLCPYGLEIVRNDNTTVTNFSLLPSAYFTIEEIYEEGVQGYHVYGGGFGHGVGMSQKGAKAMVGSGLLYDEVLAYFYNDVSISNCYYEE